MRTKRNQYSLIHSPFHKRIHKAKITSTYSTSWCYNLTKHNVEPRNLSYMCDNFLGYKSRLHSIHLLPLMHWLEFLEVMFLVRCLKNPRHSPDICSLVTFVKSCTRASTTMKLQHNFCHLSTTRHLHFNRIVLLWNAMPPVDISQSFLTIH